MKECKPIVDPTAWILRGQPHPSPVFNIPSFSLFQRKIKYHALAIMLFIGFPLSDVQAQIVFFSIDYDFKGPTTNERVESGLGKTRETLRALPKFKKNDALTHWQLATILSQQGDPNGAIEEYLAALELNPSLSAAYRELGAVYIDKHEWKKAEQSLEKGTTLNPHDHLAFYWLGRSLLAQERFPLAQTALSTATQLEPNNPETQSDLALALMAQGLFQEAEVAIKTAIRLQPDFAEAHHRLERMQASHANPHELIQAAHDILDTLFRRE